MVFAMIGIGAGVVILAPATGAASASQAAEVRPAAPVAHQVPGTVPGAPTGVWAEALAGQAWVSWNAPVDGGSPITEYQITVYRGGTPLATYAAAPILDARIVPGLQTDGTEYTFRVAAVNAVGTSALSSPTEAVEPYEPPVSNVLAGSLDFSGVNIYPANAVATSPDGYNLYVASSASHAAIELDTYDGSYLSVDLHGFPPSSVLASPDDRTLFFASDDGRVAFVDAVSGATSATVRVGSNGVASMAVSPDGRYLYVTDYGDSVVSRYNTATHALIDSLALGSRAFGLTVSADGARLYVALPALDQVAVVDTVAWTKTTAYSVGDTPVSVAVTPDGGTLFAANQDDRTVTPVLTADGSVQPAIPVDDAPTALAIDPLGRLLYVVSSTGYSISLIDVATGTDFRSYDVDGKPVSIAVSPDGGGVFLGTYYSSSIYAVYPAAWTLDPVFASYVASVGVDVVGEPAAVSALGAGGMVTQSFTKGVLVYKAGFGVRFVPNGPILDDWLAHAGTYGAPVTDSFEVSPTGSWVDPSVGSARLQYFEGVGLVDSQAHGLARIPAGQVLTRYRQVGAAAIGWPLPGAPEANPVPGTSATVYAIRFDLQTVATGPGGPWVMDNALYAEWKAEGFGHAGYPSLGYPTADSFQVKAADAPSAGSGVMEFFQAGALAAPVDGSGAATRTPGFVPAGGVLTYLRTQGVAKTGWPSGVPVCASGGCYETFDLGAVMVGPGGIRFVPDDVFDEWLDSGAGAALGYPIGDAFQATVAAGTGKLQFFASAAIVITGEHGAVLIPAGAMLTTFRSQGPAKLGWPAAPASCADGGCLQRFDLGAVMISTSGIHFVPNALLDAWVDAGSTAGLGFPTTEAFAATIPSGTATLEYFTGGGIVATPHDGTRAVPGALLTAFRKLGPATTGWPTADASDGQQQFERGILHADGRLQPPNPGDVKNCGDFANWQQANAWFQTYYPWYGDVAQLDNDDNLVPCESLPGAP